MIANPSGAQQREISMSGRIGWLVMRSATYLLSEYASTYNVQVRRSWEKGPLGFVAILQRVSQDPVGTHTIPCKVHALGFLHFTIFCPQLQANNSPR